MGKAVQKETRWKLSHRCSIKNSKGYRERLKDDVALVCNNAGIFGLNERNISAKDIANITGYSKINVDWAFLLLRRAGRV